MAWSGGTFSRTNGVNSGTDVWEQDKLEPVNILASRHDTHDQDLATGINACVNKDGSNATNVVATAWIQDSAVTTAKIADANITEAKLADDAASRSTLLLTAFKDIANSNTASNIVTLVDSNTAATSYISSITIPKAAKVTHLTISTSDTKSSGTLTIKLYKNAADSGQSFSFNNGVYNQASAITAVSFASGDALQIRYTTSAMVWTTGVTNYICVQAWGHFTA